MCSFYLEGTQMVHGYTWCSVRLALLLPTSCLTFSIFKFYFVSELSLSFALLPTWDWAENPPSSLMAFHTLVPVTLWLFFFPFLALKLTSSRRVSVVSHIPYPVQLVTCSLGQYLIHGKSFTCVISEVHRHLLPGSVEGRFMLILFNCRCPKKHVLFVVKLCPLLFL